LACGLLLKALENGYRCQFVRAQDLFDEMYASLADRSSRQLLKRLARLQFLGYAFQRRRPASSPHKEGKPFDVQRIVGKPRQLLLLHKTTSAARHSPEPPIEIHARIPAGKISYRPSLAVVKCPVRLTANAASRFLLSPQHHDPNLGISKDTEHPSNRSESRKAISIL